MVEEDPESEEEDPRNVKAKDLSKFNIESEDTTLKYKKFFEDD